MINHKTRFLRTVTFTFGLTAIFVLSSALTAKADEPTLAAILPLTGNAADQGE